MNREQLFFLELLRSGLWNKVPNISVLSSKEWKGVIQLAKDQAVLGIITDAVELLSLDKLPEKKYLRQLVWARSKIIAKNQLLNENVIEISKRLAERGIRTVLLKGQMIAQEYPKPMSRCPGDIDFYIDRDVINKACEISNDWGITNIHNFHRDFGFTYKERVLVEFHWSPVALFGGIYAKRIYEWSRRLLNATNNYLIINGVSCNVLVPPLEFNIIYEFYHLFKHFMGQGVGLRQICDLAVLLHNNKDKIDKDQIEFLLKRFRLLEPWQIFGGLIVHYLGLPESEMPLYKDISHTKIDRILHNIFIRGNFGKKAEVKMIRNYIFWERVASLMNILRQTFVVLPIFPKLVIRYCPNVFIGIKKQFNEWTLSSDH